MSKGADDETSDMEEGMTTAERRRRRRRGVGLRIPSDNVPRQGRSGPITTPVPEDPAMAMSIAYAFSDEASGPNQLPDGVNQLGDLDDATSIAEPPDVPPDGSVPGAPNHVDEDVVPDGRTRQMAAVSLEALGLSALEGELDTAMEDGVTAGNGASVSTDSVDIDIDAIEEAPAAEARGGVDDFEDREDVPITRRPATIPPPLPSRPMEAVREAKDTSREALDAKDRAITDVDDKREESAHERSDLRKLAARDAERRDEQRRPEARRPMADDGVVASRMPRAATVALSEDDLEELLELTPPPQQAPVPPPAANAAPAHTPSGLTFLPSLSATSTSGTITVPSHSSSPQLSTPPPTPPPPPTAPPAPAPPPSAAPNAPVLGNTTGEAVALAEDDLQEMATPSDASDSGEILADEIVEVEQESRAPVAVGPQTSGPIHTPRRPPQGAAPPPQKAPGSKKSVAARHAAASAAQQPSTEADKKKRRGKPWFEEVFDEDYLRTLPFLSPQATQSEALMAIESLGITAGASVLDVGCGYGRHAMELAARGFHVVGVDLSLPLLLRGADEAQRRGLDINFVHADMREMDFDAQFDGAYCLFSTFGYFDDETNKKTATLIAKALKPGAKLMLEILNRDYVIGDLPARVWWEGDGCVVLEEVEFNYFSSRVQSKRSVVFDDGRQVEQEISIRVYSLHEVGKLLHAAGLRVLEVSGSMASRGRFLGNKSREIIVVAERRPADKS